MVDTHPYRVDDTGEVAPRNHRQLHVGLIAAPRIDVVEIHRNGAVADAHETRTPLSLRRIDYPQHFWAADRCHLNCFHRHPRLA